MLSRVKSSFTSALSWTKVLLHLLVWLAEMLAKRTDTDLDDKIVKLLKRFL